MIRDELLGHSGPSCEINAEILFRAAVEYEVVFSRSPAAVLIIKLVFKSLLKEKLIVK